MARKKKLLFLIESMMVGGAERVLISLVNNLSPFQYDVTVVSVFRKSVYEGYDCIFEDSLKSHVHYKYLIDNTNKYKYKLFNFLFNRLNKKIIHRLFVGSEYDTEIAWYEGLPTTFIAHSSNKRSRKLAWLHYGAGFRNVTDEERLVFQKVYSQFDVIIGVSQGVVENFKDKIDSKMNVVACYNVIEDESVRKRALEKFTKDSCVNKEGSIVHFVCVGRLSEVKGYDRLLNIAVRLKSEGFRFRIDIVGDGLLRKELQSYINSNELDDCVTLCGNKDNPYPYIKHADWLVCASYAEGFGMAIIEALIIGTPVISTDCSGTDELLGNSEYGIRCENSENGLYEAMKSVLTDDSLYVKYKKKTAEGGRRFNKERLLQEIEQIL